MCLVHWRGGPVVVLVVVVAVVFPSISCACVACARVQLLFVCHICRAMSTVSECLTVDVFGVIECLLVRGYG